MVLFVFNIQKYKLLDSTGKQMFPKYILHKYPLKEKIQIKIIFSFWFYIILKCKFQYISVFKFFRKILHIKKIVFPISHFAFIATYIIIYKSVKQQSIFVAIIKYLSS